MVQISDTDAINIRNDGSKVGTSTIIYVVTICAMIMLLEGFDIQALGVAAPTLFPELKLDPVRIGWVFSSGQCGVVLGAVIGGYLSDLIGRRNVLLFSVPFFGIFTLALVYSHTFELLILVRFLAGFGLGAAMTNVIGMAVDVSTAKTRVTTVAIIMAGMPLGGTLVSLLARLYMKDLGWQLLFYIGGFIPLILFFFIFKLPNVKTHHDEVKQGWQKALFGENRAASTILLWIVFFLTSSVLYMLLNWLPTLMKERGFDLGIATMSSLFFNLSSVFGTIIIGKLIDNNGFKTLLPIAYLIMIIGVIGLAMGKSAVMALLVISIIGFFLLGAQYSLNGVSPMFYPKAERGFGTGAAVAFGRIGSITGPLIAGYILRASGNPTSVALIMLPLLLLAGLAVYLLGKKAVVLGV